MSEIVVLLKPALNPDMLRADQQGNLMLDAIKLKLSDIDRNAVQLANELKQKIGATKIVGLAVLTWGPASKRQKDAESALREALAMGVDEVHLVADDLIVPGDPLTTAQALKALFDKLGLNPKIILAGEATVDSFSSQLPGRFAQLLGLPYISFAKKVEVQGDKVVVDRDLEDYIETVEAPLPAVISVTREINSPRLPTLIQIRRAFKKPLKTYKLADLGVSLQAAVELAEAKVLMVKRKQVIIEGDTLEEIAEKLIEALKAEGVLKI